MAETSTSAPGTASCCTIATLISGSELAIQMPGSDLLGARQVGAGHRLDLQADQVGRLRAGRGQAGQHVGHHLFGLGRGVAGPHQGTGRVDGVLPTDEDQ